MLNIHPTCVVHRDAVIEDSCILGPFCIVGAKVKLRKNVHLMSSVYIDGDTEIDEGTIIFPYVVIGVAPQDLKYKGENTKIIIGKNNRIREHVTIHLATGEGITRIGDNCLLMVASHVAHDVLIGNNVIIDNNVLLAGHVIVDDGAILGGGSAVHQFCRVGEGAFIGGMSGIGSDIIPYALYTGVRSTAEINGVNLVGLRRKGFSRDEIHEISDAYDILFSKEYIFKDNVERLKSKNYKNTAVQKIIDFVSSETSRHIFTVYRKHS